MSERLSATALTEDIIALFRAAGVPEGTARITAEDLVTADLEGLASHGAMLVPMYLNRLRHGSITFDEAGQVASKNGACTVLDARNALGQPVARQAVALAVGDAQASGLGAVAVRNANHMGALGIYARMMADHGCIGMATSNTRPLLPAPGGAEAQTGNNPLTIAAPSSGAFHAKTDMALSAASMGKIRNAAAAGESIPDTWATDANGVATTDPGAAIKGMLLPAAGPKGFGLAFLLDLIGGGLSEGGIGPEVQGLYGDPSVPYGCTAFFLAIHVGHFTDSTAFADRAQAALSRVSASTAAPGTDRVLAPGERAATARTAADGTCTITPAARKALLAEAQTLGVSLKSFSE